MKTVWCVLSVVALIASCVAVGRAGSRYPLVCGELTEVSQTLADIDNQIGYVRMFGEGEVYLTDSTVSMVGWPGFGAPSEQIRAWIESLPDTLFDWNAAHTWKYPHIPPTCPAWNGDSFQLCHHPIGILVDWSGNVRGYPDASDLIRVPLRELGRCQALGNTDRLVCDLNAYAPK